MFAAEAARQGHQVALAIVSRSDEPLSAAASKAESSGVQIVRFRPSAPAALFFSWDMTRGLARLAEKADVVHVHSQWTFPVWWACRCAITRGKPLVLSPQGALDPVRLAHSSWKKAAVGVFDRWCLRRATVIHVTTKAEGDWVCRYLEPAPHPPIAEIPNGVEVKPSTKEPQPPERLRTMLYLGRLHPLKGLTVLLEAWKIAAPIGWQLLIAGPDSHGMRAKLERQIRQLALPIATDAAAGGVRIVGPMYEHEKEMAIRDSDVVVLPSLSENFGIVVAEALAAATPVITTKATPWEAIAGECGWWVDTDARSIAGAIQSAVQLTDAERRELGARGRVLVQSRYTWAAVGRQMTTLYYRYMHEPSR